MYQLLLPSVQEAVNYLNTGSLPQEMMFSDTEEDTDNDGADEQDDGDSDVSLESAPPSSENQTSSDASIFTGGSNGFTASLDPAASLDPVIEGKSACSKSVFPAPAFDLVQLLCLLVRKLFSVVNRGFVYAEILVRLSRKFLICIV